MIEFYAFVLIFVVPWWVIENRHLFIRTEPPVISDEADWLKSARPPGVQIRERDLDINDPMDLYRLGLIDRRECAERMTALKRYVSVIDFDSVLKNVH